MIERATRAIVDLNAIAHNVREVRRRIGPACELMAVVKADGYGHGLVEVSRVFLANGANCLAITLPEEGETLREAGIDVPILVFGLIQPEEAAKVARFDLCQTVTSLELLEALDWAARLAGKTLPIHIKVDTGMNRIGLNPEDVVSFLHQTLRFGHLTVEGIYSHLATAYQADKTHTQEQLSRFADVLSALDHAGVEIPKRHIANSAAVLDLPESYYDMVRPGLILYGLYPSEEVSRSIILKPAMSFLTKVVTVKTVPPGTPISYGGTYVTNKRTKIATLPVGYADGYSRVLSSRVQVSIRGKRVPQVGIICMDMCMVDVSDLEEIHPGDDAVLFGEGLPVEEVASTIGTINYEVVSMVGKRVPRLYRNEQESSRNGEL